MVDLIAFMKHAMREGSKLWDKDLASTFSLTDNKIAIVYEGKRYVATIKEVEYWQEGLTLAEEKAIEDNSAKYW